MTSRIQATFLRSHPITAGKAFTGATNQLTIVPGADHIGELQAWNVDTAKRVWMHPFAGSANTLYWIGRHLPGSRCVGFELTDTASG